MKFFTAERHEKIYADDEVDLIEQMRAEYEQRIEQIRPRLPEDVAQITHPSELDDALIAQVWLKKKRKRLDLTMRCGDLNVGYYDLRFRYDNFELTEQELADLAKHAKATISCTHFSGDAWCHEVDLLDDGRFEHSILFHHIWELECYVFNIRCQDMQVRRTDRPSRKLPKLKVRFRST